MRFIDTNVLVYLISKAPDEAAKSRIAGNLLEAEDLALSVQVLQEFYVQAVRTLQPGRSRLSHEQAAGLIASFLRYPVQAMTVDVLQLALSFRERFGVSYWDASILAAATTLGCETVLSEDLSDGQQYGTLRVINPFRSCV